MNSDKLTYADPGLAWLVEQHNFLGDRAYNYGY